jgi:3-phenylpropionate/cinnamic acid dioxygenase small subunit
MSAAEADAEQIARLVYTYAERLDAGDFEGVADLFAQATFRSDRRPEVRRGRDEVLAVYRATVATYDGSPSTRHVTTNLIVEVAPDRRTATARSYFTVFQARPELPLQPIIAGRYHDRFARGDAGWRFDDRLVWMDLLGDLRFHLKRAV